jgi:hypothetical protein
MNKLHVGFSRKIEPPLGSYLWIADEVPKIKNARVFDPMKHCFDPLKGMDYKKAAEFVAALQTLFPGGENTLTKEDAEFILLDALLSKPKSLETLIPASKDSAKEKARRMMGRLLLSPILKRVLCSRGEEYSFNSNWRSVILARINRAKLGEFDSLALGHLLMLQFKGQIVVPDFGFYGREIHMNLLREERLIVGVNTLAELPPKLRQSVLLIKDKVASGTTVEDAETLAKYARFVPGTVGFNDFVAGAIA